MAVYTFLESYDLKGKTLVPFNTSASGGFGRSLDGICGKRGRRDHPGRDRAHGGRTGGRAERRDGMGSRRWN